MMARLLDDVASRVAPGGTESGKPPQQNTPLRRLSFKTRQASTAARPNYRSTKVSLTSNNVAVIASKFNTIVIDDGPQGRALLRKLSSNQRKTGSKEIKRKTKMDGVVKAAIEMFEQQDSEKNNQHKPPFKRGNDRPKLVVVRKSSSKLLSKSEESTNVDIPSKLDSLSKECAKDIKMFVNKDSEVIPSPEIDVKEIKRKPSLKAKPNIRHVAASKQELETSLNQKIEKFNVTRSTIESKEGKSSAINNTFVKPNFNLNDRIAQFNKNDEINALDIKRNKPISSILVQNKNQMIRHSEEKENSQDAIKSILRNTPIKQTNILEVTKDQVVVNVNHIDNSNQRHCVKSEITSDKKQNVIKDKVTVGEKKGLKVFQSMPDIIRSAEIKAKKPNDVSLLCSENNIPKDFPDDGHLSTQNSKDFRKPPAKLDIYSKRGESGLKPCREFRNIDSNKILDKSSVQSIISRGQIKGLVQKRDSFSKLKSALKQHSPGSPNFEKKNHCSTPDKTDNIQLDKIKSVELDRIKPNNSFLWKPTGGINLITEVPIYDDRPQCKISDGSLNNDTVDNNKTEFQSSEISESEKSSKPANTLNLDIASSFILEMTEHIDKRFSNGSVQEGDFDFSVLNPPTTEPKENVKNSSFLHGKSESPLENKANMKQKSSVNLPENSKPDLVQSVQSTNETSFNEKSTKSYIDCVPPKLPEKRPKSSTVAIKNLNPSPPPIPPSHTKPKQAHDMSDENWLNNCKKILEIPPPLRKQNKENSVNGNLGESVMNKKVSLVDQSNKDCDKRFSVSQVELLRKMSEMNLNKWNSLPPDTFSLLSSHSAQEDEDHYTSIQHDKEGSDDQDSYEMIGENNYAEIAELKEYIKEDNNIYQDVVEQDQEDHYEAINCVIVQHGDSDSSCDQSNSLYGLTRPTSTSVSGAAYQTTGGSETSDEWVDLDNSDDQQESIYILRENDRGRGLAATESWSMKVRRQWSRKATDGEVRISSHSKIYFEFNNEHCLNNLGSHPQVPTKGLVTVRTNVCLCNKYEAQEAIIFLGNEDGSDDILSRSYTNVENLDDTAYCDDFDDSLSDSSFENETITPIEQQQVYEEKRSQPLTEGIYGLMKQAGKSMRKHWTLGKSLTRIRKNKSASSILPSTNLGQRGWSFKAKDKPSSTFYLHTISTPPRNEHKSEPKVDPRRLSTASMVARPTSPPPPPPPPRNSVDENNRRKSDISNTNNSSGDNEGYAEGQRRLSRNMNGNSMWYIETSTDSASEHGSSQGSDLNLRFADEPLYQFYAANIAEMTLSAVEEEGEGEGGDGYEEITPPNPRPSPLDLVAHNRSLWCEVPQVLNSRVLDTLTVTQKRLQEAKFEVMTSEASYFKSLSVLDKLFASCPLFSDDNILSRDDRKVLFGNVHMVRKSSEKLLVALQKCWQNCILLQGICDVVHDHVKTDRDVFVRYCTNQISMDRTLKRLKHNNSNFNTVLSQLETDPECQSLTLYSFLMLPMQRITRLRLLFETMLTLLAADDSEFTACQKTLEILNKCVMECNEGARSQERYEEMATLSRQLEFPPEMAVPLLGGGESRWLVRSGQLTLVNMDAKQTFGRRLSRTGPKYILFLLTDLLLVTKKKSEESYLVIDHCQRNLVETQELRDFPGNNRCLLQVTLLQNSENKTMEMTLSCDNEMERQRWLQVLSPPRSEEPGEILYEDWDCPQVSVVHAYQPNQPDELLLAQGDIINVLRKSEGWYFGERTRDGEKGWFPGNYTREIASKHVRARNIKQRHRLLQLSADFVLQQRKIKS